MNARESGLLALTRQTLAVARHVLGQAEVPTYLVRGACLDLQEVDFVDGV